MEPNQSAESVGRGLRGSVVIASLVICLLLLWMVKGIFTGKPAAEQAPEVARGSSFQAMKKGPTETTAAQERNQPQIPPPSKTIASSQPITGPTAPTTSSPAQPPVTPLPSVTAAVTVDIARASGAATDFGSITGKVTLKGTPPPESPLPLDPSCGKLHPDIKPTTQFYVTGKDSGLADVFVYISKGMENRNFLPPEKALVLDQIGCVYTPYVAGAQTGQTIEVRISDPVLHNVHPTPTVRGNQEINKAMLPKSPPLLLRWNNPEVFLRFKCDVHPWMFAYVGLVSHPYFAVTDTNGNFTIPNVPPGTYELEVIHRKAGKTALPINVKAGDEATLNYAFEISAK